ncbi:hypothetical protein BH09ACT5_BH09ACT5_16320 [soil metagenome]
MTAIYLTTGAPAMGGDPDSLDSYASDYDSAATSIQNAAASLLSIADDDQFVSLAIDEVAAKVEEASKETAQIAVRFSGAAEALAIYSAALRTAKAAAAAATTNFEYAVGRFDYWNTKAEDLAEEIRSGTGDTAQLTTDLTYATGRRSYWQGQVTAAESSSTAAFGDLDDAAQKAISAIDQAMADSSLNDTFGDDWSGFWEGVYEWSQEYLAPVFEFIMEAADLLSTIVGWIAFAVSILAIFLPVLAPLAGALSLIALGLAALSFLAAGVLTFLGKMSTNELGQRGVKFAISAILSKVGLGGVIGNGTKAATSAAAQALVRPGPMMSTVIVDVTGEFMDVLLKKGISLGVNAGATAVYPFTPAGQSPETFLDPYPNAGGPDWNVPPLPSIPTLAEMGQGAQVTFPDASAIACTPTN